MIKESDIKTLIEYEVLAKNKAIQRGDTQSALEAVANLKILEELIELKFNTVDTENLDAQIKNSIISRFKSLSEFNKKESTPIKFLLKGKGVIAYGYTTDKGFIVLKGSQAVLNETSSGLSNKSSHFKRKELIDNTLLKKNKNYYVFAEDIEFNSPSLAASVILGNPTSGPNAWKTR